MESIYYVMAWACHRRCKHCYEDRFRPYVRDELAGVVDEAVANFPRIIANLPDSMAYRDLEDLDAEGLPKRKIGRVILAGGESLLDPVRERVTYKVIEALSAKYAKTGGVKIIVQTTGDLVTPEIVDDLLARGVWSISCAGFDDFHVGLEGEAKQRALMDHLAAMFAARGMIAGSTIKDRAVLDHPGPIYNFFGATPDAWIGKLWPRGRAWSNGLSTATLADNFCNRWSGGLNFLRHGFSGSEVSIDPTGDVYPCCIKTKLPLGTLLDDKLIDILDSLAGDPVYEAIAMGHPERMGITAGWDVAKFIEKSATTTPAGKPYRNLCIGCDKFHEEVLAPRLEAARARRRAAAE